MHISGETATTSTHDQSNIEDDIRLSQKNGKKVRGEYKKYSYRTFGVFSKEDYERFKCEKKFLSKISTTITKKAVVDYYRCNLVRRKDYCPVRAKISANESDQMYHVEYTTWDHIHSESCRTKLSAEVKSEILALQAQSRSVKRTMDGINTKHGPNGTVYSYHQVRHAVSSHKNKNILPAVTIGDVVTWVKTIRNIPNDLDTPFALSLTYNENIGSMIMVLSTKRLLQNATKNTVWCTDSTYKLNWQGYPLLIVGTFDAAKHFHLIAVAISKRETVDDFNFLFSSIKEGTNKIFGTVVKPQYIMSDAAPAIRNGFLKAFPHNEKAHFHLMCRFHVYKNVKESKLCDSENRKKIFHDLDIVAQSIDLEVFHHLSHLFIEKWKTIEPQFSKNFQIEWLTKCPLWFSGANILAPSTNNGIEGFNSSIKRCFTFRERLSLTDFKETIMHMIGTTSKSYDGVSVANNKNKTFVDEQILSKEDWLSGLEFSKNENHRIIGEGQTYYIQPYIKEQQILWFLVILFVLYKSRMHLKGDNFEG